MRVTSVEGASPSAGSRRISWRWFAIGLSVLVAAAVTWAAISGTSSRTLTAGIVLFGSVLLVGAWPVLGAGLLRGKEEGAARDTAKAEGLGPTPPTGA